MVRPWAVSILSFAVLTAACSGNDSEDLSSDTVAESDLIAAYWVLEEIDVRGVGLLTATGSNRPTIQFFREGRASADDSCNTSSGTYAISGGDLSIASDGFWTLAGCFPDGDQAKIKAGFHEGWSTIERVRLHDEQLTIDAAAASMTLRRYPRRRSPIDGTRWGAHSIDYGRAELLFDLESRHLTIEGNCSRTVMDLEPTVDGFVGISEMALDVCDQDGQPGDRERMQYESLVFQLKGGFSIDDSTPIPVLRIANGETIDLWRASSTEFGRNSPPLRALSDHVFGFHYLDSEGIASLIRVDRSGSFVSSKSEWEWRDGELVIEDVEVIIDLVDNSRLRALRSSLEDQADGGCGGVFGEIQDLWFRKNPSQRFNCTLDATPENELLSETMEAIRSVVGGL